ncbi:MAG: aldo/keto reductase [Lentisphaeria bacterium]|nr:aldo/keto reductase [Lentisphaeria bacterium]
MVALHGVNNAEVLEKALNQDASLAVLRQAQKDGRIGHIGFSTHGPTDVIIKAIESDFFDYVNLHWYYMDQMNLSAINAAARRDMGVFIISPSDKGGKLYEPPKKLVELCDPFSPMAFNDLFCLANRNVHTLSVGAAKPEDFDAHLEALPWVKDGAKAVAPVVERLNRELADILGLDWATQWASGIPDWTDVPGHVNVYHTLRLYTVWKAFDMLEYGRMRYNLLGNGGHWFPGEKVSAADWNAFEKTIADSPFADVIPAFLRDAHAAFNKEDGKRLSESG